MFHVYSTATCDMIYTDHQIGVERGSLPQVKRKVLIRGGSNIADRRTFVTNLGIVTTVTDEDMQFLKNNKGFQDAVQKGFMTFSEHKVDPEVAAAEMDTRDGSAPLRPEDFAEKDQEKEPVPVIGEPTKKRK